jgi:hypothetical protein
MVYYWSNLQLPDSCEAMMSLFYSACLKLQNFCLHVLSFVTQVLNHGLLMNSNNSLGNVSLHLSMGVLKDIISDTIW